MSNCSSHRIFTEKDLELIDVDNLLTKLKEELVKFKDVNTDAIKKKDKEYHFFFNNTIKFLNVQSGFLDSYFKSIFSDINEAEKAQKMMKKTSEIGGKVSNLIELKGVSNDFIRAKIQKRIEKLQEKIGRLQRKCNEIFDRIDKNSNDKDQTEKLIST